jgi:XRE family aerobic/anaerobic benzoate catabolism transcriptional regulator
VAGLLGESGCGRHGRIALIGLRGAGKSTLGRRLAAERGVPFVELSAEVERIAGCSVSEIHALYGQQSYRRHERRALEEAIERHRQVVIATPGGLVSDPATFHLLLVHCTTVWLQADPQDHMNRVRAQGDLRPMADSKEAMHDLEAILADRSPFYSKADVRIDTSRQPLDATLERLRQALSRLDEKSAVNMHANA